LYNQGVHSESAMSRGAAKCGLIVQSRCTFIAHCDGTEVPQNAMVSTPEWQVSDVLFAVVVHCPDHGKIRQFRTAQTGHRVRTVWQDATIQNRAIGLVVAMYTLSFPGRKFGTCPAILSGGSQIAKPRTGKQDRRGRKPGQTIGGRAKDLSPSRPHRKNRLPSQDASRLP